MPRHYKTPCIEEAICELTFAPNPDGRDIDLTLPGNLQAELGKVNYPGPTQNVINRTHVLDATLQGMQITEQLFRVQLPSKDQRFIISIGRDTLSVSNLRPYGGWGKFKPEIERVFTAWPSITTSTPRKVIRVGLRYINRLVTPPNPATDHWLNHVPPPLLASDEGGAIVVTAGLRAMNDRREYLATDGTKIVITMATLEPQNPSTREYLIDIDALTDTSPLDEPTQIIAIVEKLHIATGAVFESTISAATRILLDA